MLDIPAITPPPIAPALPPANQDALNEILAHNLWDKQRGKIAEAKHTDTGTAATAATTPNNSWQLKGIILPDTALLKTANRLKHYHRHDQLPDGAIIRRIFIDGIALEKNTKHYNVYLFGKKP